MEGETDIVDLGAASIQTQGFRPGIGDEVQGMMTAGLTQD